MQTEELEVAGEVEESTEVATEAKFESAGEAFFYGLLGDELDLLAEKHPREAVAAGMGAVLGVLDAVSATVTITAPEGESDDEEEESEGEVEITLSGDLKETFFNSINT